MVIPKDAYLLYLNEWEAGYLSAVLEGMPRLSPKMSEVVEQLALILEESLKRREGINQYLQSVRPCLWPSEEEVFMKDRYGY